MSGIYTLTAALIAFAVTGILGKWMVPFLHKIKFGQTIREVGPKWHEKKNGTPTMGGFMFIIGILVALSVAVPFFFSAPENKPTVMNTGVKIVAGYLMALGYGFVGFIDDYIKVIKKRNLGLTEIQKLILQFLVAGGYLLSLGLSGTGTVTMIPFFGGVDFGIWYWVIAAIGIVGMVNAVNFTDGLDGLNTSVTFFVSIFFMLIAGMMNLGGISILSAACAGGCLGFLLWNFHPAKVFMGDTGSLFLGGMVCALAFGLNVPILLIPIGIIYIIEILSVVIQVTYFKATHGKRIFKMAPIHHHFEMCGWSEVKVCVVFSGITIVMGFICLALVWFGLL